ncbi:glycosyltransferase [Aquipuribacter sp. MA13-6]|uniref:glycosyltransferase n=1 Tax=unclassified Aquipuribacter TaxID=2635084 RepID=UPI003EF030C2
MRLTLLTPSFADTQLLRTKCLIEVAQHLGHEVTAVTTQPGEVLASLRDQPFTAHLRRVDPDSLQRLVRGSTDVLMTVKALQVSLGAGLRLARATGVPLLADVDDPDLEVVTIHSGDTPADSARRMWQDRRLMPSHAKLAVNARRTPTTVSNPALQRRWGGVVVPHARPDPGDGAPHTSSAPLVGFIGTSRGHKGLPLLRAAVARLADEGWRLLVTEAPPTDAAPWEQWVGPLDGRLDPLSLTAASDVVVIPSEAKRYGSAQLPLKLVDAMLIGRAVVVSDVGPLPWAVGPTGPVFRSGSLDDLVAALRPLADPRERARRGAAARALALSRYTVPSVAPLLERALQQVGSRHGVAPSPRH